MRENLKILRAGWRPLLGLDVLCKLLTLALLAPASALLLQGVLSLSGSRAVSNYDLAAFFLSPEGLFLIVVMATLTFAVTFFELGGLAMISLGVREGKRISAVRTLNFLGRRSRSLFSLGLRQFLIFGGIWAAVLAVAALTKVVVVGEGDIYFYIRTRPPEFQIAVLIILTTGLVVGILSFFLLVRWIFSVPLLLLNEELKPGDAMAESRRLVRMTGTGVILKRIGLWLLAMFLLWIAAALLCGILERLLMGLAGDKVGRVIAFAGLLLAIRFVVGLTLGFVMTVTFVDLVARLLAEILPGTSVPDSLLIDESGPAKEKRLRKGRWILGSAAVITIVATGFAWLLINGIQFERSVAVSAHRGSSEAAPENTVAAIEQAIADGSDYVEIDVQETSDGIVVVIHDTDLRRLAGINRNTWEIPYAEMKEMDIGSWFDPKFAGERVMTLEEAIEAVRGKAKLNVELKFNGNDKRLETETVRILEEKNFVEDAIVMSLDYGAMQKVKESNGNLKTGLTLTARIGDPTNFEVDFLAVNANAVTRDLVARAHRAGKEVHVWTVNDPEQMLTMIHLGVDNIITDVPAILVNLLKERAKLSNAEKALLYVSDFLEGRL